MAKRGRKRKGEEIEILYTEVADKWLQYISTQYEDLKSRYESIARKSGYDVDEDLFSNTILYCYESISRNDLKDTSEQGMRNYLYRAFQTNLNMRDNYCKRKDDVDDFDNKNEEYTLQGQPVYEKTKKQLFDDYSVIYIFDRIEQNFNTLDFHVYRIKHLMNYTYAKLKEVTGIKDCKKRVVKINKWVKENITYKEVYNAFITDFPGFED